MKPGAGNMVMGKGQRGRPPVLLAITPPRTGERTLLGVENLLGSIAVPEPFSLEMAGDAGGVTLMARCIDGEVVRGQIAVRYPQARIDEVPADDDPFTLREGEQAWEMTLRSGGPGHAPLRTFRDEDLLDAGSDPLMAIIGALSSLNEGERIVSRLLLRSLGPDWADAHRTMPPGPGPQQPRTAATPEQPASQGAEGLKMAVLGLGGLAALKGYFWVRDGETWKAVLLGLGLVAILGVGGWAWARWKGFALPCSRPAPRQGEGLEDRLRRRGPGHGHPAAGKPDRSGPQSSWSRWQLPTATTTTRPEQGCG